MKVRIDEDKCIGCGICVDICPEGIELINGKARIKNEKVACLKDSVRECPTKAIILEEGNPGKTINSKMKKKHDLIIVGAGPAGLTAAIYAGRYMLNTLILGEIQGGTITEAYKVCNFPSEKEISGMDLAFKMLEHVKSLGVKIKQEKVQEIKKQNNEFKIKTNKKEYFAKKIILAIGRKKEKLSVKGEDKLLGKGVSYCAVCDASFFKNKTVAVIGGSDAALTASFLLAEHAKKIYIIYRREKFFRVEPILIKQVEKNKKIKTIFDSNVKEIYGNEKVEGIKLDNNKDIKVDGVFIEIGSVPYRNFLKQLNLETKEDYIKVNKKQQTSIEGIYAAGDVTNNPLKQIITAAAEGAIAASSVYEEIKLRKDMKGGERND